MKTTKELLDGLDLAPAHLEHEWVITIDTPVAGVEPLLAALGEGLPLRQGPYDNCLYVREGGFQQFRALEGSHAGDEGTIQRTAAAQVVFSMPADVDMLRTAFEVIFAAHVNEEPTIRVTEALGSRSKLLDADNPNRYWNQPNADEIHGDAIAQR